MKPTKELNYTGALALWAPSIRLKKDFAYTQLR